MEVSQEQRDLIVGQTRKWITDVVIACNFCPFAAREMKRGSVHYAVTHETEIPATQKLLLQECLRLNEDRSIETTLIVFARGFVSFSTYLQLVSRIEKTLQKQGYKGIYQVATFHPDYRFAGSSGEDAANFTNRSPYPMLHLLREDSIAQALKKYEHPDHIPTRNIEFARSKGAAYMKMLRDSCL